MSPTVVLRGASKWYGAVIGVNEVSVEFSPGITGLLGPNGAGKSTLMKLMAGQLKPSIGDVCVLGRRVWGSPKARLSLGFTPEADAFYEEMTGFDFVLTMARLSGLSRGRSRRRTAETLERVGMAENSGKRLRACSKGMRQRIKIAQALVHDPEVLILDEPLSGVDVSGRTELLDLFRRLRDEGKTLIISTHILHEIQEVTSTIVLLDRGRVLAAGTLGRIRDLLAEYPLTVRISAERRRTLAGALLGRESVVAVSLGESRDAVTTGVSLADEPGDMTVKVRRPEAFFRELPQILEELNVDVTRVEALDASAEAIFRYLVTDASAGFPTEVV